MEVVIPSQSLDFDFNSARSSPHVSAPSTPRRIGEYYFSAPASPSHLPRFYKEFGGGSRPPPAVPFDWEDKPGTPKSPDGGDFAFDVSRDWETASSLSADDLFDGGVIKPMKMPPSPSKFSRATGPSAAVSRKSTVVVAPPYRGRDRGVALSKPPSRRAARSLSPTREPQYLREDEEEKEPPPAAAKGIVSSALAAPLKGPKKWCLKDFFLFRSASEGRAAGKDPLRKYTAACRRSSFRVIDSPGSGSRSTRRGPVSAHELHYTVNRAISEDLKKKTFLPYKQGILGRLAFNPAVHALSNGFGLSRQ